MKNYKAEETIAFKAARLAKTVAERQARKNPTVVWDNSKGSFVGSIRQRFTGPKRNNFQ